MSLPTYVCHKRVEAFKIGAVVRTTPVASIKEMPRYPNEALAMWLMPDASHVGVPAVNVSHDYMRKHKPQPGGYFVRYKDGYESYSPADAFEDGYTKE